MFCIESKVIIINKRALNKTKQKKRRRVDDYTKNNSLIQFYLKKKREKCE